MKRGHAGSLIQRFQTCACGATCCQAGARRERGLAAAAAGGALPQVEQACGGGDQPPGMPVAARQALERRRVRHRGHHVAAVVARVRAPARAPATPRRRRRRGAPPGGRVHGQARPAAPAAPLPRPRAAARHAGGRCLAAAAAGRRRLDSCRAAERTMDMPRCAAPLRVKRISMAGSAARPLPRPCAHTARAARPAHSGRPGTRCLPSPHECTAMRRLACQHRGARQPGAAARAGLCGGGGGAAAGRCGRCAGCVGSCEAWRARSQLGGCCWAPHRRAHQDRPRLALVQLHTARLTGASLSAAGCTARTMRR